LILPFISAKGFLRMPGQIAQPFCEPFWELLGEGGSILTLQPLPRAESSGDTAPCFGHPQPHSRLTA